MRRLLRGPSGKPIQPPKRAILDAPTEAHHEPEARRRWHEIVSEVGQVNVFNMQNGMQYVLLDQNAAEMLDITKPPQCQLMAMVEGAQLTTVLDPQEMVHRFTVFQDSTHSQRDGYLWYPDVIDMPIPYGPAGNRFTSCAPVRAERCTFTPWGERAYFRPRHGIIYLGYSYR